MRSRRVAIGVAAAMLVAAPAARANVPLTRVSADPFGNPTSQHATEVEPDTFANGATVVATFQVGRFFDGGATDIGFARSGDGGTTWTAGFLPGMTFSSGAASPFERVSNASVAYDAAHATWLISSIPLLPRARPCRRCSSTARPMTAAAGARRRRRRRRRRTGSTSTRTGRCATTARPARSAATATPSSTTSATATASS